MRYLAIIAAIVSVMALAYWAYLENYRTQAALAEVGRLKQDIATQSARLQTLTAEWAYLNRPERLAELADLNADLLGLMPLGATHFRQVADLRYRPPELEGPITGAIDLMAIDPAPYAQPLRGPQ